MTNNTHRLINKYQRDCFQHQPVDIRNESELNKQGITLILATLKN